MPVSKLNPEIVEQVRTARRVVRAFERAGRSVRLWEALCVAHADPLAIRSALERSPDPSPELFRRLQSVRDFVAPVVDGLRPFLPPEPADSARQDLAMALMATSPPALESARRWIRDPKRYRAEALRRLGTLDGIVEPYLPLFDEPEPEPPPPPVPPGPPTGLAVAAGNGEVSLAWTSAPGASRYRIRRALLPGSDYAPVAETRETSFIDHSVANGSAYAYAIVSAGEGGESPPTPPAEARPVAPPETPSGLLASPGQGQVFLTWNAASGATRYRVKRATERRGPYATVASPMEPSWLDRDVTNGTTYFYVIRATNAGGRSAHSAPATAIPAAAPAAPDGPAVSPGPGQVSLFWAMSPHASGYRVKRSTLPGGPYAVVAETADLSHVDRAVTKGTTYYYVVSALNGAGESPDSRHMAAESQEGSAGPATARMDRTRAPSTRRPRPDETAVLEDSFSPPEIELVADQLAAAPSDTGPPDENADRSNPPAGVDLVVLTDLRHFERLEPIFRRTGQRVEPWEFFAFANEGGPEVRRFLDRLSSMEREGRTAEMEAATLTLLDRLLKIRAEHGAFARKLRAFFDPAVVTRFGRKPLEIAYALMTASEGCRSRADRWFEDPARYERHALLYMERVLNLGRKYAIALEMKL